MKKRKTLALCLFITAVCFSNAAAQPPDASGKAVVYFYSYATTTTLGRVKKPVFLDDKEIAEIRPARFFIALVEPGKRIFRLRNKKFGGIEMEFDAGKTYYLRINWETDAKLTPAGISRVEPESGAYDIKQLRPVGKENIKDRTAVVTQL